MCTFIHRNMKNTILDEGRGAQRVGGMYGWWKNVRDTERKCEKETERNKVEGGGGGRGAGLSDCVRAFLCVR